MKLAVLFSTGLAATLLVSSPAVEAVSGGPATYQTETGIVKLGEQGSHAAIVKLLRETLKR